MTVHDAAWHRRRSLSGGASDFATVIGCSPYAAASPLRLAWEKRGLLRASDEPTGERVTAAVLEQAGRSYLGQALGCTVDYNPLRDDFATVCSACHGQCHALSVPRDELAEAGIEPCCDLCATAGHAHANLDGQVNYKGRIIGFEGKSISWNNPDYDAWSKGRIPEHVEWQVQQQLLCARLPAALVLVFDSPHMAFSTRVVEADPERHAFILQVWGTWWQQAVIEKKDPATRWAAVADIIKQRWPDAEPGKSVVFGPRLEDVASEWVAASAQAITARRAATECREELKRYMEDASRADLPSGNWITRTVAKNDAVTLRYYEESK